jgi:hypothetical protein
MNVNKNRLILWIIVGLLALPLIIRLYYAHREASMQRENKEALEWLEAERNRPGALQERVENLKKLEKMLTQLVHGDRMETKTVSSTMATISLPDDLLLFSAMAVSRDSAKIAVAGADGSSQHIYVAPFPPKDKNDFEKVASIPGGIAIGSMRWNDLNPNMIGLISFEATTSDHRLVLYTIDILKKETREAYVVGSDKMIQGTQSGGGCL